MVARRSAPTTSTPVGSPRRRWSIPFCIWFPLAIFAATRLVNFIMISLAARHQVALYQTIPGYYVNTPMPASPSYLSVVTNWDGQMVRAYRHAWLWRALSVVVWGCDC